MNRKHMAVFRVASLVLTMSSGVIPTGALRAQDDAMNMGEETSFERAGMSDEPLEFTGDEMGEGKGWSESTGIENPPELFQADESGLGDEPRPGEAAWDSAEVSTASSEAVDDSWSPGTEGESIAPTLSDERGRARNTSRAPASRQDWEDLGCKGMGIYPNQPARGSRRPELSSDPGVPGRPTDVPRLDPADPSGADVPVPNLPATPASTKRAASGSMATGTRSAGSISDLVMLTAATRIAELMALGSSTVYRNSGRHETPAQVLERLRGSNLQEIIQD